MQHVTEQELQALLDREVQAMQAEQPADAQAALGGGKLLALLKMLKMLLSLVPTE